MIWIALAAVCAARIAYLFRPIEYSGADEADILRACYGARLHGVGQPSPLRRGHFFLGRLALWLQRWLGLNGQAYAALAVLSTLAGCAACAVWIGYGWQTVLIVGTSPLLFGLGRRALSDAPLVAAECLTLVACHGCPWVAVVLVAATLMIKESAFSALTGLALWSWLSGDAWWPYPVGLAIWALADRRHLRWLMPRSVRRGENEFAHAFCHGGWLRLTVDLVLVSPVVVGLALWSHDARLLAVGAIVAAYGGPWLHQQIRTCIIADVLLRVIVAQSPWWWLTLPIDAWVFWRVWWRARTYDPSLAQLAYAHGMAPAHFSQALSNLNGKSL